MMAIPSARKRFLRETVIKPKAMDARPNNIVIVGSNVTLKIVGLKTMG